MKRLFSGIQPTGELHIGNYLGAIKNWVELADKFDAIFCIVDYHAISVEYEIHEFSSRTQNLAAGLLACGLVEKKCTLFVQSHVQEHTELAWVLNSITPMGDLSRMTQFKDKSRQNPDNINAGLFSYPVLQAADILIYKAEVVPVGEDQVQHIELSREIARKFNARYGETFPEPKEYLTRGARILGLDGQAKMSKSLNNHIGVFEDEKSLREKLRTAFTDPARLRRSDPGNPDVCNIFTLHKFFTEEGVVKQIDGDCRKAAIGCVECKKILADRMVSHLTPLRERYEDLTSNQEKVRDVLSDGFVRCSGLAKTTMNEVRERLGLFRP
ncbi:MAG: tryptophan--tRNA ligase [Deltaproteobacteria bacterium]|nr:tryptophan--tRNA ligase [Deltaproteobacteria bacterium]